MMAFSRILATWDLTTIGLMSLSSAWSLPLFLERGTSLPSYRYYGMLMGSLRSLRIWAEISYVRR